MYKKLLYSLCGTLFLAIFILTGYQLAVKGAACGTECSKKEIGTYTLGAFSPTDKPLIKDLNYWVRITIKGQNKTTTTIPTPVPSTTVTSAGSDIMMVIDTSGSMRSTIQRYSNSSTETISRAFAAREAMNKFVDLSDEQNDYLGLATFTYCGGYSRQNGPFEWAYEGISTDTRRYTGFSAINANLQSINGRKQFFKDTYINRIFDSNGNPTFCTVYGSSVNGSYGATSVGGGITAGNTVLTPILNHPNSVRNDGSSYRDSRLGTSGRNNGPQARQYTQNKQIPKYMIVATDGLENEPPYAYDQEIDRQGRSIVATAVQYGVKIYTILIARPGDSGEPLMKQIASQTGGQFYSANSLEELLNSFTSIRNEINDDTQPPTPSPIVSVNGSSSIVQENINSSNFKISPLVKNTSFILKKKTPSGTVNITDSCGSNLYICVANSSDDSIKLNLPPAAEGEEIEIYFMVTPTQIGQNIAVDSDTSTVTYEGQSAVQLDNIRVNIVQSLPYFETQGGGDTFSSGGITVNLPDSRSVFSRGDSPGVVLHSEQARFTPGRVSNSGWKVQNYFEEAENVNYLDLFKNIKNYNELNGSSLDASGYYHYNGDFVINSNTLPDLSRKRYVIFVDGNLYIRSSIRLPTDGRSLLAFIVSKNIGIHPSVSGSNPVRGVFIANGVIDTACAGTFSGEYCSPNKPDFEDSQLTLEGMFFSRAGYNLDRRGNRLNSTEEPIPGEKFIYRPEYLFPLGSMLGTVGYLWQEIAP